MKLYLNKASPYARLALVVAHEKGLADALELVWVDPWASAPEFVSVAPLARVPALVTDDGATIPDSAAICDYLDAVDATVEKRFHPEKQPLAERWGASLAQAARYLESRIDILSADEPDLGDLCIAVGLAYTDFRLPHVGWRQSCARLAAWQDRMLARKSLAATAPE